MSNQKFTSPCISTNLDGVDTFTFEMSVKDLAFISYVAVRGVDVEVASVQRPLSARRIESIRDYVLAGNTFFNSFLINWTEDQGSVGFENGLIHFDLISRAAQVIDGQHRLAGLEDAMEFDETVASRSLIVTMCVGLTTPQAAKIFLNINTEQKPVPKSLLFDLFGETGSDPNHAVNRARDIAQALNDDRTSPLYNTLKFPGAPRGSGKIELSTFVTALKRGVASDGEFNRRSIKLLDDQIKVVLNFFDVIRQAYVEEKLWSNGSQNPFLKAAGFNGAIDFLLDKLIFRCAEKGSFTKKTMAEILSLESRELLKWDDLRGQDGKTARKNVYQYLEDGLSKTVGQNGYDF